MQLINNNLGLMMGIIFILIFLFKGKIISKLYGIDSITASELKSKLAIENVQLVDVRSATEYKQGHIQSALNIPLSEIHQSTIEQKQFKLDKAKPIYLICASGNRSLFASIGLKKLGFSQVYNVSGGMIMWSHTGQ